MRTVVAAHGQTARAFGNVSASVTNTASTHVDRIFGACSANCFQTHGACGRAVLGALHSPTASTEKDLR